MENNKVMTKIRNRMMMRRKKKESMISVKKSSKGRCIDKVIVNVDERHRVRVGLEVRSNLQSGWCRE